MTTEQPVIGQEYGAEPRPEDGNVQGAPGVWCIHDEAVREMVAGWAASATDRWSFLDMLGEWSPVREVTIDVDLGGSTVDTRVGETWRYTPPSPPHPLRKVMEEMREDLAFAGKHGLPMVAHTTDKLGRWADAIEAAIEEVGP